LRTFQRTARVREHIAKVKGRTPINNSSVLRRQPSLNVYRINLFSRNIANYDSAVG
jgi:hypothetical protein